VRIVNRFCYSKKKFTLLELIIVTAILGILVSLLLPSLRKAKIKAKLGICKSNQAQMVRSLILDMKTYALPSIIVFKNSTLDAPWEAVRSGYERNPGNHARSGKKIISPGNPAVIMAKYTGPSINFCPLGNFDERDYYPPQKGVSWENRPGTGRAVIWGTYGFFHGKVTKFNDKWGRNNGIIKVNDKSNEIAFMDTSPEDMNGHYKDNYREFTSLYKHYVASFSDGSARYITDNDIKRNQFLWDSPNWAR
jgi:prepilin-type N-terminal cleavage/methylation domain-containing protein